jgi:Tfp pilus assembly protein PilX
MLKNLKNQNGMAVATVLVLLLMISLAAVLMLNETNKEIAISGNEARSVNSFWAAEAGAEKAMSIVRTSYQSYGVPPSPLPCDTFTLGNYTVTYGTVDNGPAVQSQLTDGSYTSLYALVKTFTITSEGVENKTGERSKITQVVQDALVPIYQFAVFYEGDLEIHPGPLMTLAGRVHTNSNMYLGSDNLLNIDSYTTAAGNIYHDRKGGAGLPLGAGDVKIKDAGGIYQNMQNPDGSWLDSRSSDWTTASVARWGGRVEDRLHGATKLNLPIVKLGENIDLIKRGTGNPDSYEHLAGLKLVEDGHAWYKESDSTWSDVTTMLPSGTVTTTMFFDAREGKYVTSKDIDIGKLNTSGYFPSNGVIYASTSSGVARLKNSSQVGAPLTVASDNPLYIWGDFNTVDKKPASLMADALTILSNSWDDSKSDQSLNNRVASNTTVNCCFMTGNQNTGEGTSRYNGGLENVLRFLEKWDNKTVTFKGSIVDLWNSKQATGSWSCGGYYTPPSRNWQFDTDLLDPANLPPATPKLNILNKTSWSQG